jgi:Alkaline phosphatase PhoX
MRTQASKPITTMVAVAISALAAPTLAQFQTAAPPYMTPVSSKYPNLVMKPVLTCGDTVGGFTLTGLPDGIGAYDNGDGTFTVLIAHEFSYTTRHVNGVGAYVSRWVVRKSDLAVMSGERGYNDADVFHSTSGTTYQNIPIGPGIGFGRFCSSSLASTAQGMDRPIFMCGEETSSTRTYAAAVAGDGRDGGISVAVFNDGTKDVAATLPRLGRLSHEQQLVIPGTGNKTAVWNMDDTGSSNVFLYVGDKQDPAGIADPVEATLTKNGLNTGNLFAMVVTGARHEGNLAKGSTYPATFTPVNWDQGAAALHNQARLGRALVFTRLEDAHDDPNNPGQIYFCTTGGSAVNRNGRLYRFTFTDLTNPAAGGSLDVMLDGSEGMFSPDNVTIADNGNVYIQEDPASHASQLIALGRDSSVWEFDPSTNQLDRLIEMDGTLGLTLQGASYRAGDWESSGIIDLSNILGPDQLLLDVQAHYSIPGIIQGGQLVVMQLGQSCYADCDHTTGPGVLDVFDFLCFQNAFVNADPYACDCDTTTGPLVCDMLDFICFQDTFFAGCP